MSLRLILTSFILVFIFISYGQNENSNHCSKRSKLSTSIKSASLSVEQISLTELYDVHFYQLDIAMNNVQTNVAGTGEIYASAKTDLDSALFELHSNFNIAQIRVNTLPVMYSRNGSAIKVPVNALSNENFVISIDYSGVPPTGASTPFGGGGMTQANSPSWGNRVTWSLSEPFSAYEWWPCKQSLTDKADSCAVKITVPDTCKAGSNGILENVVDLGNGFSRYEWKHRHPIDYYLISVAVAKYIDYTIYANPAGAPEPIMIQNYIYDNPQTLINFQDEIDETVDFIELFYDLYGPYPFEDEKYGHCMAPLSGGMEHQTMTTQGFFEKGLTAHELGHQWWGNNVTCASWSDIWVNEGFASYSEFLMLENLYTGQQNSHMSDVHENVMSQPNGSTWVLDSLNENRIFSGRLTYDKGSAIIHTLRYIVDNDALFFQTLRDFQNDFADSTAKGVDIKQAFEGTTGLDLTAFFEQWYFGEGYPTYSLRWNEFGNDILLQVSHTASFGGVTPTFTNPIDVRILRSGQSDTIITLDINSNLDQFYFTGIGDATSMTVDPQNWVVNKVGTILFDQNLLGLDENNFNEDLILFPNPSNGIFTVKSTDKSELPFVVYHMNGKVFMKGIVTDGQTIDLKNANAGSYLIEVGSRKKLVSVIR